MRPDGGLHHGEELAGLHHGEELAGLHTETPKEVILRGERPSEPDATHVRGCYRPSTAAVIDKPDRTDTQLSRMDCVVTPRAAPDLDGLSCAVAYAELLGLQGFRARAWISTPPDPEAAYAVARLGIDVDPSEPQLGSAIALVDASDLRGLPVSLDPERVVEVIDHRLHQRAAELFPNAKIQIEAVGAAATLVWERFHVGGHIPTATSAQLLQAAIVSNTQNLRGSVTTERDRAALVALREIAPLPDEFIAGQFDARRRAILADLAASIWRERKDFDHPDGTYSLSQLEFPGARHFVDACFASVGALGSRAMLNLVDVEIAVSWLLVPDAACRAWVERRAGLVFSGSAAESPGVLLRKQIVYRLAEET